MSDIPKATQQCLDIIEAEGIKVLSRTHRRKLDVVQCTYDGLSTFTTYLPRSGSLDTRWLKNFRAEIRRFKSKGK